MSKQNLAYEFDLEEIREHEQSQKKKISYVQGTKTVDRAVLKRLALFVMVAAMFMAAMMYGKVELSSLYTEQARLEAELEKYDNENKSLESELAQKTGLTKVEDYAENELGLQKLNKSQIEYIRVDKGTVSQPVSPDDDNMFMKIKKWWNGFLEYIGAK